MIGSLVMAAPSSERRTRPEPGRLEPGLDPSLAVERVSPPQIRPSPKRWRLLGGCRPARGVGAHQARLAQPVTRVDDLAPDAHPVDEAGVPQSLEVIGDVPGRTPEDPRQP